MVQEKDVSINGPQRIEGTIAQSDKQQGSAPAVLILAGSGPIDRNGNTKGFQSNIYKDLSDFLVSLGFVTLRYDKRGTGASSGDFHATGMWDLVEDATSAIDFLRQQEQVDPERIIILGHSEGCILAVAAANKTAVQGLILLASESALEAVERQRALAHRELNSLPGLRGFLIRKLNVVEKDKRKAQDFFHRIRTSHTDTIRYQFQKINAKWWREHLVYDFINDLQKITCPVLALTGSKDVQTNPEFLHTLEETVRTGIETHLITNMNHLLKLQEEEMSILKVKKVYQAGFKQPLPQELQDIIRRWMSGYGFV